MNEVTTTQYATDARSRKLDAARAVGIDDALISRLVEAFYSQVRNDDLLGPIFSAHVSNWNPHLARMKDFWASIIMESGRYLGQPMQKHITIGGLEQRHFDRGLTLWRSTVDSLVTNPQAAEQFRSSADRIAKSLLMGIQIQRGGLDAVLQRKGGNHFDGS
ncbi:MAG: group III truncated hemoglobin [Sphingorhabdus sp.]